MLLSSFYTRTFFVSEQVEIPAKIEQLCFPDGIDGPMDRSDRAQCYSLVMTNEHGVRTFGYCRRILPEGSENCLPLAYCILSKHRAPRFYKRILEELESRHGLPDKLRDALLSEFYYRQFPRPGESIKVDLTKIRVSMESEVISVNNNGVGSCGKQCEGGDNLDLKSYVIVNNNGEYGTLKRTPRANGVELRKPVRGQSAFINRKLAVCFSKFIVSSFSVLKSIGIKDQPFLKIRHYLRASALVQSTIFIISTFH